MATKTGEPQTLLEAIRYFSDLDVANDFIAKLRWPDGFECPACGHREFSYLTTRRLWKCKACKKQTSVKKGTIFEDSPLGLDKWLAGMWLVCNCKNGVSSHELARDLGVHQQSAWFMLHRVRLAMETGTFLKVTGEAEADETYVGGRAKNMHKSVRARKIHGPAPPTRRRSWAFWNAAAKCGHPSSRTPRRGPSRATFGITSSRDRPSTPTAATPMSA